MARLHYTLSRGLAHPGRYGLPSATRLAGFTPAGNRDIQGMGRRDGDGKVRARRRR